MGHCSTGCAGAEYWKSCAVERSFFRAFVRTIALNRTECVEDEAALLSVSLQK